MLRRPRAPPEAEAGGRQWAVVGSGQFSRNTCLAEPDNLRIRQTKEGRRHSGCNYMNMGRKLTGGASLSVWLVKNVTEYKKDSSATHG